MSFFSLANFDILGNGGQSSGVTEDQVRELINQHNTEVVQGQIQNAVTNAAEDYDDTKIYDTYDDMIEKEPTGREDVLYIITNEDNTRYIWNGSAYTAIEGRIDTEQISNLFNE